LLRRGTLPIGEILVLAGKIVVFIGGSLLVGWRLVIPFIERVRRESMEILVITVVGYASLIVSPRIFLVSVSLLGPS
jgi:Kef-type K+ transport system membrane component KefB